MLGLDNLCTDVGFAFVLDRGTHFTAADFLPVYPSNLIVILFLQAPEQSSLNCESSKTSQQVYSISG